MSRPRTRLRTTLFALIGATAAALAACGGDPSGSSSGSTTPGRSATTLATNPATTSPASTAATTTTTPVDSLACRDASCAQATFDYLIVTRPMFVDALQPFAAWKTDAGHRVGLVTVEWLDTSQTGDHLAERMKTGLHALAAGSGVRWVLLVGDTAMAAWDFSIDNVLASLELDEPWNVPTGWYRRVASDPPGEVLPADAYFVEDRDWDVDGDGLNMRAENRELGEGTLAATIFLGRWPVRTTDEVAALTTKTKAAVPADDILFTVDSSLSDGIATSCSEWPPARFHGFFCYLDTMVTARTRFFEGNAPHLATAARIVDLTNAPAADAALTSLLAVDGVAVVSFHGNYDCWGLTAGDCVGIDRLGFEHVFPLLEAEACLVGEFYFADGRSLAESLLLAPTGPAVFTQAPNPALFLEAIRNGTPVGEAFWATAATFLYYPNPIRILGDPSLVVLQTP
jgi:hypothetical protein